MSTNETIWRVAELNQLRRERLNRIRSGVITPAYGLKPQLLVKDDTGRWCPEIKGVS